MEVLPNNNAHILKRRLENRCFESGSNFLLEQEPAKSSRKSVNILE